MFQKPYIRHNSSQVLSKKKKKLQNRNCFENTCVAQYILLRYAVDSNLSYACVVIHYSRLISAICTILAQSDCKHCPPNGTIAIALTRSHTLTLAHVHEMTVMRPIRYH